MTWLFKDEVTPPTAELLNRLDFETGVVPSLWPIELTNVMSQAERRGRITPAESEQFLSDLGKLTLEVDTEGPGRAYSHVLPLCRTHRLTSYDAVYLELAVRREVPLATIDLDLAKAAKKLGVKVLGR